MTTSTLKIIKNAGTQADQIFAGMFGQVSTAGNFEFDTSLMGLDVAKLTQISIKKGRESFPESALHTVQAEPEVIQALKGVLISALQKRWTLRYQDLIGNQPPGVASTLTSAMEVDNMTVDASLELMGFKQADTPLAWLDVSSKYEYTNAQTTQDMDGRACALSTSTLSAVTRLTDFAVNADTPIDGAHEAGRGADANFFHGTAAMRMHLPAVTTDQAVLQKLVEAMLKMPANLLGSMGLVTDCRLTNQPEYSQAPRMPAREIEGEANTTPALAATPTALIEGDTVAVEQAAQSAAAQFLEGVEPQADFIDDDDVAPDTPANA